MVNEIISKNKETYACKECKMRYLERDIADKCEAWCKKHKSCNLEITKHAINKKQLEKNGNI